MSVDDDVSILWSKLPEHQADVECITLDSPPDSPPENLLGSKMSIPLPSTSTAVSAGFGFSSIKLMNAVNQPETPEDSEQEHSKEAASEEKANSKKKRKKKKKKKKELNPIKIEKMIEQIKEAGVLEKNRQRKESEDSVSHPRVKWQRYFEVDFDSARAEVNATSTEMTERDHKKAAERAERLARIEQGRVSKLSRRMKYSGKKVRCLNCHQWGHMKFACPDKLKPMKCHMCAGTGHTSEHCPRSMCLRCGKKTYNYMNTCRNCNPQNVMCARCNCQGHEANSCPELWRRFHSTVSGDGSAVSEDTKLGRNSVKPSHRLFCCGCARRGHSIDTCNFSRGIVSTTGLSYVCSKLDALEFSKPSKNKRKEKKDTNSDKLRSQISEGAHILKRFKRDLYS